MSAQGTPRIFEHEARPTQGRAMTLAFLVVAAGLALAFFVVPDLTSTRAADETNMTCASSPGSDIAPLECANQVRPSAGR